MRSLLQMSDEVPSRSGSRSIRGRGAADNPPNRFQTLWYVEDDEARSEDDPLPRTRFLKDPSRSIIATNDSPDVPFDASINPYRGCEHGCVYCLDGGTRVLMGDGTTRELAALRRGDEIYGTVRRGWYRRLVRTRVVAHWRTRKPAYRVALDDGTSLVASGDHRFLTLRGWKFVTGRQQGAWRRPHLTTRDRLLGIGCFATAPPKDRDYRLGYLWIRQMTGWPIDPSDQWRKGFLAGIWDAEGSYSGGVMRIPNTDSDIVEETVRSLRRFGFAFTREPRRGTRRPLETVRITGGGHEHFRFFQTVEPAINRKRDIAGVALKSAAKLSVASIEALPGVHELYDITTGTGDFIANGVVSHNCYARPTHEYLGFSAGLDFETQILVKEKAPELLRKELGSPRWKPQVLAMSGVTDPYQPGERRFRLTRGCLEVLLEFRNPVGIVTKNHLVTRDLDLLRELSRLDATSVYVSVTTLDAGLTRRLEPRACHPERRLSAIAALRAAGVPVGVLVAPIIPALNDTEISTVLSAAARAGARFAGYVMLRLPHGVAGIFEDWLDRHYPERKNRVLNRLRAMRGGELNDPRFGERMRGRGIFAEQVESLFAMACRREGLERRGPPLSTSSFRRPGPRQLTLFD